MAQVDKGSLVVVKFIAFSLGLAIALPGVVAVVGVFKGAWESPLVTMAVLASGIFTAAWGIALSKFSLGVTVGDDDGEDPPMV